MSANLGVAKAKNEKAKTIALWVVTGLVAFVFVLAGYMKFVNSPEMPRTLPSGDTQIGCGC